MPTRLRRGLATVAAIVIVASGPVLRHGVAGAEEVRYRAPVDGPVVDPFRPPAHRYGPGNRGIDYATEPGQLVGAAADGEVVFAGQVGGGLHVVVLHADGIRTSLSFLAQILVVRGQRVAAGEPVGRARAHVHFGARRGDEYIDPAGLLSGPPVRARLVPDNGRPLSVEEERSALARLLAGLPDPKKVVGAIVQEAAAVLPPEAIAALGVVAELGAPPAWQVAAELALARLAAGGDCTPESDPTPSPPAGRRILVLVGGLGSSSGKAAIHDVDARRLGYAPADVHVFSYRGGTTATTPYGARDTMTGIEGPARLLAELLGLLADRYPGVPVDLVAHSMGGLVSVAAVGLYADPGAAPANLITLGTPHGGADLARAAVLITASHAGELVGEALTAAGAPDGRSQSMIDLTPGSQFLRTVAREGHIPPATSIRSVGARTDLIVPRDRTLARYPGAVSVTVDVPAGVHTHDSLPGSDPAHREIALALDGAAPTCRSLADQVADAATSVGIQRATATVAVGAAGPLGAVMP